MTSDFSGPKGQPTLGSRLPALKSPSVIHGRNMNMLKENLASLLNSANEGEGLECRVNNISVSCVMALYFLSEVYQDYCSNTCKGGKDPEACENCNKKPYHVLFQQQE